MLSGKRDRAATSCPQGPEARAFSPASWARARFGVDIEPTRYCVTAVFATDLVAGQVIGLASPVTTLPSNAHGTAKPLRVTVTSRFDVIPCSDDCRSGAARLRALPVVLDARTGRDFAGRSREPTARWASHSYRAVDKRARAKADNRPTSPQRHTDFSRPRCGPHPLRALRDRVPPRAMVRRRIAAP